MSNINLIKKCTKDQVALFRFSLIAPLVNGCYTQNSQMQYFRDISSKLHSLPNGNETKFSAATIKRWYINYNKLGMDSLIPKRRSDSGNSRAIAPSCIEQINVLKDKFPHITGKAIYKKLIEDGYINSKDVSIASVYRFLNSNNLKTKPTVERKAFEMQFANDCWQCDTSHGPFILIDGKKVQTYLIQIIDDASRLIVGSKFFLNDNSLNLQFVLKQAVKTYGIPKKIFVDNGKPYQNIQFQMICASIGSTLIYAKPYSPESKGKIERSFRTIKDNFINCTDWNTFESLEDLNFKYHDYLNEKYNNVHHSSIDTTPRIRFNNDSDKLRFVACNVDELFMHSIDRKVALDATVKINCRTFEVPQKFIKQTICIKFYPDDLSTAFIYNIQGEKICDICEVKKVDNSKIKRNSISFSEIKEGQV